jgi:lipopolysaccharide/colanic/teichoic acid biosynthesis glycosyltransferase
LEGELALRVGDAMVDVVDVRDVVASGATRAAVAHRLRLAVKRVVDVLGAALLLVLTLPLTVAAAAAVRLADPGPVLFRQERVGRDGRLFTIYKFRTMVVDQDAVLDRSVYEARERAGLLTKLPGDPRVTRIGRLLRRSSVDELPQLLNVLKGEMSLVGPRPLVTRQLDPFPAIARERAKMRPGMTGAWQVSDRARYESVESMADADLDYVRRYRLWRDLWIVLCTLPACCRSDTV